jgi:hypothetical protein
MGTIIRLQLVMTLARLRGQWNHLFTLLGYAPYAEISHGNRSATCYGPCERRDASKTPGELYELFSKPIKSPQKAFRTYQLSFENGEPVFTLSEVDRILEGVFEEIFGSGSNE